MSVLDTLIFDRTQADLQRLLALKSKALENGYDSLTPAEKAEYAASKGAYNASDLNRVGAAVAYVAAEFVDVPLALAARRASKDVADDVIFHLPYDANTVVVTAKQDWAVSDIPTQTQKDEYLGDLNLLANLIELPSNAPLVPVSLDNLTFSTANNIELLLIIIDSALAAITAKYEKLIDDAAISYMFAGEVECGE